MDTSKLKRNSFNQAVINNDIVSYNKYNYEVSKSRELRSALAEVKDLRKDVDDIKDMLKTLINGMNKDGQKCS
jgi:hypothetical protein